jgi:hypothetical protein
MNANANDDVDGTAAAADVDHNDGGNIGVDAATREVIAAFHVESPITELDVVGL